MSIDTKYNIGDEVWYKGFKDIFHDRICNIRIDVDSLEKYIFTTNYGTM